MKKTLLALFCLLFSFAGTAGAIQLHFDQSSITVDPLDMFTIDLLVSDLGVGGAPSVGDFDVDILFDETQVQFEDYALGTGLGDVSLGDAWDFSWGYLGFGSIDIAEVSALSAIELNNNQLDQFVLATLTFSCLGSGTSFIEIDSTDPLLTLGDADGNPLDFDLGGPVQINQTAPVPEPSTILLVGTGLLGIMGFGRKRLNKKA